MIFLYEHIKDGIRIIRVFGKDEIVEIPEEIEHIPVTELGAYVFSDKIDRADLEAAKRSGKLCNEMGEEVENTENLPEAEGVRVKEVSFPTNLKKIGRYAFYNCSGLKKLSFHSALMDIGAGAFTGCHKIGQLSVTVKEDGVSCLRELLSELPEEMCVEYRKNEQYGKFWYPEFFEEGVENTPARILENHVHGSGIRYRNAFHHKVLNIHEYDELFPYAIAWENECVVTDLALGRLLYPMELTEKAEKQYLDYLKEHLSAAAKALLKDGEYSGLRRILENICPPAEKIEKILHMAEMDGDAQAVSICMDYLHRHKKKQRKVFEF